MAESPKVAIKFLLNNSLAGSLIGTGGTAIKELIELSVPKDKILYIDGDNLYDFEHLTLIPIRSHLIHFSPSELLYLQQTITPFLNDLLFKIESPVNEHIAVIKSSKSSNVTNDGIFMHDEIVNFCNKNMITLVEPTDYSEDNYAQIIHGAKKIIFSWGTTFMKGMLYISDNCKHIDVLVYGEVFQTQYNLNLVSSNPFPQKYKQSTIKYNLISSLNMFTLENNINLKILLTKIDRYRKM
jgi:hypothetical protein